MTSPLFALFTRSVREDTRAKSTYWARAGLVAFMLVVLVPTAAAYQWQGAPGLAFFKTIIFLQTAFITLSGLGYFASVITEEKEEEMLGLLRLTRLNGLSILLGKSTARLCGALLLLAAQFPFTLLAITLGGISTAQIIATYCALGAYLFLLSNLALLASALAHRTTRAALITAATLAAISLAGSALNGVALALRHGDWISDSTSLGLVALADSCNAMTPAFRLKDILVTGFHDAPCGPQFWSNLVAGLACFFVAWFVFERRCEDPLAALRPLKRQLRRQAFALDRPPAHRSIEWKDFRFLHGGRFAFASKIFAYTSLATLIIWSANLPFAGSRPTEGAVVAGLFAVALALETGWAASRVFSSEVHGQTLSALTLLPLRPTHLLGAKVSGILRAIQPAGCGFLLGAAWAVFGASWNELRPFPLLLLGTALVTYLYVVFFVVAHVFLFAQVTAYLSLRVKRGSFLLAIAIWCALSSVASALHMPIAVFLLIISPLLCALLGAAFQTKILQRLEDLAAEG